MSKNNNERVIGIVTWFFSGNYGSNLQALALYHYLSSCNFECHLIRMPNDSSKLYINKIKQYCPNFILDIWKSKAMNNSVKWKKIKSEFSNLNIDNISSTKQFNTNTYNFLVTGSDQIWNPYYLNHNFLLDFPTPAKKVAYSSGFGVSKIPIEFYNEYEPAFNQFSNIAVREERGKDFINKLLNTDSTKTVVDPVFLRTKEQWGEWANNFKSSYTNKDYLLCYFVGPRKDYLQYINKLSKYLNISNVVIINSAENPIITDKYQNLNDIGNSEFIKLIQDSKYIITDSFHATALALIFEKNFSELLRFQDNDDKSQNNRILELLERYNLKQRILDYTDFDFCEDIINYQLISKEIENDVIVSKDYLSKALEG